MKGLVTKSTGSWYTVKAESGDFYDCQIRGKFRLTVKGITNPLAVGDYVDFEEKSPHTITVIHPRENYLIRKAVKKTGHGHMIASNIDQAILVATVKHPKTSLGFIDRFLISAEGFRIPQIILFNKIDLLKDKDFEYLDHIMSIYKKVGVLCLPVSAETGEGLEAFKDLLLNKTSLIGGHSGVGKSTILNKIHPNLAQKTAEISDFSDKGKHTTTFAEMFFFDDHSKVIDTPGIKELGLIDMEDFEIADYFPEMRPLRNDCKFNNCLHLREPGCAIKTAVEEGEVSEERYSSYISMITNDDNRR